MIRKSCVCSFLFVRYLRGDGIKSPPKVIGERLDVFAKRFHLDIEPAPLSLKSFVEGRDFFFERRDSANEVIHTRLNTFQSLRFHFVFAGAHPSIVLRRMTMRSMGQFEIGQFP